MSEAHWNYVPGFHKVARPLILSLSTVGRATASKAAAHYRELIGDGVWFPPITVAAIDPENFFEHTGDKSVGALADNALVRAQRALYPERSKVLIVVDGKLRFKARSKDKELEVEVCAITDIRRARVAALSANAKNARPLSAEDINRLIDAHIRLEGASLLARPQSFRTLAHKLGVSSQKVERRLRWEHPDLHAVMKSAGLN